jgi:3-oxoadipate enol-lactonase
LPVAKVRNIRLFYRMEGRDDAPVLVFSHSIGTDHGMWDPQIASLLPYFRMLRYDTRGHGGSDAPQGDYSIEQLGHDGLVLPMCLPSRSLHSADFHWAGLSASGSGFTLRTASQDWFSPIALRNLGRVPTGTEEFAP